MALIGWSILGQPANFLGTFDVRAETVARADRSGRMAAMCALSPLPHADAVRHRRLALSVRDASAELTRAVFGTGLMNVLLGLWCVILAMYALTSQVQEGECARLLLELIMS